MTKILSVDPGLATGIALGYYSDEDPYQLIWVDTLHDGVTGVAFNHWNNALFTQENADRVILENYIVRPGLLGDPVALEVIGFIKGVSALPITMRLPSDKGKAGFMDSVLKKHGLWRTGKQVNHTDGRDANDAIIHALTWLIFKEKHQPTIDKYMTP